MQRMKHFKWNLTVPLETRRRLIKMKCVRCNVDLNDDFQCPCCGRTFSDYDTLEEAAGER
jgi:hypothetical protein